jgi:hypothetical protein
LDSRTERLIKRSKTRACVTQTFANLNIDSVITSDTVTSSNSDSNPNSNTELNSSVTSSSFDSNSNPNPNPNPSSNTESRSSKVTDSVNDSVNTFDSITGFNSDSDSDSNPNPNPNPKLNSSVTSSSFDSNPNPNPNLSSNTESRSSKVTDSVNTFDSITGSNSDSNSNRNSLVNGSGYITATLPNHAQEYTLEDSLKKLWGKDAKFSSSSQELATRMTLNGRNIIYISATGSGKTATFQVPSVFSSKVFVVIVPLIGLKLDLKNRLANSIIWDKNTPLTCSSNIILVSFEDTKTIEFNNYFMKLIDTKLISHVVFDEIHLFFTSSYRSEMAFCVSKYCSLGVPFLLLSASISSDILKNIEDHVPSFRVIRGDINRPNLKYQIVQTTRSFEDEIILTLNQFANVENSKVVLFCNSRDETFRFSSFLNKRGFPCLIFNGGLTVDEKSSVLQDFKNDFKYVVCTSGFGTGVDIPNINLIIHIDDPHDIISYSQETGRSGRNGCSSNCIWIRKTSKVPKDDLKKLTNGCIRGVINSNLGQNYVTCSVVDKLCSYCESNFLFFFFLFLFFFQTISVELINLLNFILLKNLLMLFLLLLTLWFLLKLVSSLFFVFCFLFFVFCFLFFVFCFLFFVFCFLFFVFCFCLLFFCF